MHNKKPHCFISHLLGYVAKYKHAKFTWYHGPVSLTADHHGISLHQKNCNSKKMKWRMEFVIKSVSGTIRLCRKIIIIDHATLYHSTLQKIMYRISYHLYFLNHDTSIICVLVLSCLQRQKHSKFFLYKLPLHHIIAKTNTLLASFLVLVWWVKSIIVIGCLLWCSWCGHGDWWWWVNVQMSPVFFCPFLCCHDLECDAFALYWNSLLLNLLSWPGRLLGWIVYWLVCQSDKWLECWIMLGGVMNKSF